MTSRARRIRAGMAGTLLAALTPAVAAAQTGVPLSPEAWVATDSIRCLPYAMRIEVAGTTARLYVNGAAQPCLVINDLKHGDRPGRIGLWAHVETDAYFGPISIAAH
jgi:hypothetical protein